MPTIILIGCIVIPTPPSLLFDVVIPRAATAAFTVNAATIEMVSDDAA